MLLRLDFVETIGYLVELAHRLVVQRQRRKRFAGRDHGRLEGGEPRKDERIERVEAGNLVRFVVYQLTKPGGLAAVPRGRRSELDDLVAGRGLEEAAGEGAGAEHRVAQCADGRDDLSCLRGQLEAPR